MLDSPFSTGDWVVFALYFLMLLGTGYFFSQKRSDDTSDYFLASRSMSKWMVAISVLATAQSAATFLGGPDQGYQSNLTYVSTNIGAILAAFFIAKIMIPRYYQYNVSTTYELLQLRFGEASKRNAGLMYLIGRVFASGARLYLAALAVSMILYGNIEPQNIAFSIGIISFAGIFYTFFGGIRSVIWSDIIQCGIYVSAGIGVAIHLWMQIPADAGTVIEALQNPLDGSGSKLTILDFGFGFGNEHVFSFWTAITGFLLLNIAAFGMDQDMTQRLMTCKTPKEASKAMLMSSFLVLPIITVFIVIGFLLYIYFQRPDIMNMGGEALDTTFAGQKITVFMHYVLNDLSGGLRGLVTIGVIAAALSSLNSSLNSMSSVIIQDFYRPLLGKKGQHKTEHELVVASRVSVTVLGVVMGLMAMLCYYWQQSSDMPLLPFALSVMVFAYSGLLGVFFTLLFTKRGNSTSATLALIAGFVVTMAQQSYVLNAINPAWGDAYDISFPWQLCIGAGISMVICLAGQARPTQAE